MHKNIITLLILLTAASCSSSKTLDKKLPNIVYILTDDMGYGDLKCNNSQSKIRTSNIDSLAAGGMIFSDAHSGSSVCTPTRYGIITGRYAWRTWLKKSVIGGTSAPLISPKRATVASVLKTRGYQTAMIGKWHLGWDFHFHPDSIKLDPLYWGFTEGTKIDYAKGVKNGPDANGFDYYYALSSSLDIPPYLYVENGKLTNLDIQYKKGETGKRLWRGGPVAADFVHEQVTPNFVNRACDYIKKQANSDKPFFLYLALPSPHTPIMPVGRNKSRSGINEYADFVMQIDDHVGQLTTALKKSGQFENTLVIFTADNGTSPRADIPELAAKGHDPSGGLRGRKADIFEGGHRIPYIASWPAGGIKPGSSCDETVCLTDLLATCAEISGAKLDDAAGVDSVSNLALLRGEKVMQQREAIVHHSINGSFAIRQGDWKLIFCPGSGGWKYSDLTPDQAKAQNLPDFQLYNLEKDPGEKNNLQAKKPKKVAQLTALMAKIIRDGRSTAGSKQQNTGLTPFLPHEPKMSKYSKIDTVD